MAAACLRRLHRIPHPVLKLAAATHWPLPFPGAKLAPVTQSCPSADRVEVQLSARCPAFFLGLSNGSAFAQEDSVSPAAASEHAEGNAPGLQPIEDGSVVSNEHTVKWRIYTDNAREFFQKAKVKLLNTTLVFLYSSGFLNLASACFVLEIKSINLQFHHRGLFAVM
ncbi:hypothetical protein Zm00014a_005814 [Zea mays]|uniref:Uncharacterized protein n=1 Tax=Zea mays TaxID=4577 RepID=A0A3L6EIL2_MAIZE|nr:hypothetical protein Zm00014a_005814 [Zea mays]